MSQPFSVTLSFDTILWKCDKILIFCHFPGLVSLIFRSLSLYHISKRALKQKRAHLKSLQFIWLYNFLSRTDYLLHHFSGDIQSAIIFPLVQLIALYSNFPLYWGPEIAPYSHEIRIWMWSPSYLVICVIVDNNDVKRENGIV